MSSSGPEKYLIRLRSKRVQRELDNLQEADYRRVLERLKMLADNPLPYGCEKLFADIYRIRIGDFRIIYRIDLKNKYVDIGGVRRRSEKTYRNISDLF